MRKGIAVPIALAVACMAGVGIWKIVEDPLIEVPDRVCRASVLGSSVQPLFPQRGEAFKEEYGYGYSAEGVAPAPGLCELSAGGKYLRLTYTLLLRPEVYGWDDVSRDAKKAGNIPISLGTAEGFAEGHGASLYMRCIAPKSKEILLVVKVSTSGSKLTEDRTGLDKAAALTADLARNVAPRVEFCGSAPKLPPGPPSIG